MYEKAIALIREFEGCRLEAYQDVAGVWTIGYGHTGPEVNATLVWTQQEADAALLWDIGQKAEGLKAALRVPLSDNEMAALLSLAFNIGLGAVKGSTALHDINIGDKLAGFAAFTLWNRAGGQRRKGLLKRRCREILVALED